jgi:hypothetical protein
LAARAVCGRFSHTPYLVDNPDISVLFFPLERKIISLSKLLLSPKKFCSIDLKVANYPTRSAAA